MTSESPTGSAQTGSTQHERPYDCLLLDFGGVCLLNPVELHDRAESRLGLPADTLTWKGPIDPSTDELWQRMVAGDGVTERQYWAIRAGEVGVLGGTELDVRAYMNLLYLPADDALIRPECTEIVERAQAAGISVSVLTNDLRAFHGREWEHDISLLRRIDQLVDCSDTDILKPDPRAFDRALAMTGFSADRILFVDDQPLNVAGAEDFGIESMWFDIANAARSWHAVAAAIGV